MTANTRKPLRCWLGSHDYIKSIHKGEFIQARRGPFDQRSEQERTKIGYVEICARCGDKRVSTAYFIAD